VSQKRFTRSKDMQARCERTVRTRKVWTAQGCLTPRTRKRSIRFSTCVLQQPDSATFSRANGASRWGRRLYGGGIHTSPSPKVSS